MKLEEGTKQVALTADECALIMTLIVFCPSNMMFRGMNLIVKLADAFKPKETDHAFSAN